MAWKILLGIQAVRKRIKIELEGVSRKTSRMRELEGEHQERRNTSREIEGTFLDRDEGERRIKKNKERSHQEHVRVSFH